MSETTTFMSNNKYTITVSIYPTDLRDVKRQFVKMSVMTNNDLDIIVHQGCLSMSLVYVARFPCGCLIYGLRHTGKPVCVAGCRLNSCYGSEAPL